MHFKLIKKKLEKYLIIEALHENNEFVEIGEIGDHVVNNKYIVTFPCRNTDNDNTIIDIQKLFKLGKIRIPNISKRFTQQNHIDEDDMVSSSDNDSVYSEKTENTIVVRSMTETSSGSVTNGSDS